MVSDSFDFQNFIIRLIRLFLLYAFSGAGESGLRVSAIFNLLLLYGPDINFDKLARLPRFSDLAFELSGTEKEAGLAACSHPWR